MKLLLDTNVILDVMLERQPFVEHATILLSKIENGIVEGYLCATTLTTLEYLLKKELGDKKAKPLLKTLLTLFDITAVNRLVIESALSSNFDDFEDAVLYESALHSNLQGIVTRDKKGFKKAKLATYSSEEIVKILDS